MGNSLHKSESILPQKRPFQHYFVLRKRFLSQSRFYLCKKKDDAIESENRSLITFYCFSYNMLLGLLSRPLSKSLDNYLYICPYLFPYKMTLSICIKYMKSYLLLTSCLLYARNKRGKNACYKSFFL